jgi:hypothetical protein
LLAAGDWLSAIQNRLSWPGMIKKVFMRAKFDCTGEMGAGQFSIFGAVEEKSWQGFSRTGGDGADA